MSRLKKGSFEAMPNSLFEDDKLSGADFRVAWAIAKYAHSGANGRGCFASHSKIAKKLGMQRQNVTRSIARLKDRNHIIVRGKDMFIALEYVEEKGINSDASAGINSDASAGIKPEKKIELSQVVIPHKETEFKETPVKQEGDIPLRGSKSDKSASEHMGNLPSGNADDLAGMHILSMWDDGPFLAKLDREVRNGRRFRQDVAEAIYQRLEDIFEGGTAHKGDDPIAGRAYRLLETDFCRDDRERQTA